MARWHQSTIVLIACINVAFIEALTHDPNTYGALRRDPQPGSESRSKILYAISPEAPAHQETKEDVVGKAPMALPDGIEQALTHDSIAYEALQPAQQPDLSNTSEDNGNQDTDIQNGKKQQMEKNSDDKEGLGADDIAGLSTLLVCGVIGSGLVAYSVYQHYLGKNSARAKAQAEQKKGFDNINYEGQGDNDLQTVKVDQSTYSGQTEQRY